MPSPVTPETEQETEEEPWSVASEQMSLPVTPGTEQEFLLTASE